MNQVKEDSLLFFLSDSGIPWVRSMGPSVSDNTFCRLNWRDSGWWRYQLDTNWYCQLGNPRQCGNASDSSDAIWWPTMQLMQVVPSDGQQIISNYFQSENLFKFKRYTLGPLCLWQCFFRFCLFSLYCLQVQCVKFTSSTGAFHQQKFLQTEVVLFAVWSIPPVCSAGPDPNPAAANPVQPVQ